MFLTFPAGVRPSGRARSVACRVLALGLFLTAAPALGATYNLSVPDQGSSGNFGYNYVHSSSSTNPASGTILATGAGAQSIVGTYDDVSGDIRFEINLIDAEGADSGEAGTVSGTGNLNFGVASGALVGSIDLTFSKNGAAWNVNDAASSFSVGFFNTVYGGTAPIQPNSLNIAALVMTLWGADDFANNFANPTLGIDLVFNLIETPLPAALPLFLSALAVGGMVRRRTRQQTG